MATKKMILAFPTPFDVKEACTNLREVVSLACECEIRWSGMGLQSIIEFVLRNFKLFGIDFLREVLTKEQVEKYRIRLKLLPHTCALEVLEMLLGAGCQLSTEGNFRTDVFYSSDLAVIDRMVQAGQEWNPARMLSPCRTAKIARYFVELGAHITLEIAFASPIEVFEYYCRECGIDVNAKLDERASRYFGMTYLHRVIYVQKCNYDVMPRNAIKRLLALGADPDIQCGTKTARQLYGVTAWERDFSRTPFMATLGDAPGTQWRFEFISDKRLKGQRLEESGMREIELTYKWFGDEMFVFYEGDFVKVK